MVRKKQNYGVSAFNKLNFLTVGSLFVTILLIFRLFNLQIVKHGHFQELATQGQYGFIELPAQRGNIIIKDYHSEEEFLLATNTVLHLLFADPALIEDPAYVSEKITPLIFDLETERELENARIQENSKNLPPDISPEEIETLLTPLSDIELEAKFQKELTEKIGAKQRQQILLGSGYPEETLQAIKASSLAGVEVIEESVYAYPPQISNTQRTAEVLEPLVEIPKTRLAEILKGVNRYVVIQRKLGPEISEPIRDLMDNEEEQFRGLGMQEEYFRYYPEGTLGSHIAGYVSRDNVGQYGIESSFNTKLQGKAGKLQTKRDSIGRQITVGESTLDPAVDGDDVILTVDRSVQLQVEKILEDSVKSYNADGGQVIVMDPKTSRIIAMANYPTFNPNEFGQVFQRTEIEFTAEEIENLYPSPEEGIYFFYKNPITLDRYLVFEEKDDEGNSHFYRYENYIGPEAYQNKVVSWPYEPGSVFKTVAMAIAIDDGEITPNTTYNDVGPVGVDWNPYTEKFDFEIKNSEGYFGLVNMTTVLAESLNTGMTYIAKEMGANLFYSYLKKFGFLDRTDIEFDGEITGKIAYFEDWTESELATHAFGQGLTVTMVQLANSYSAIINGGILRQPYIIDEVRHDDGTKTFTDPIEIRRVISEETSSTMIAMLTNAVENGVANKAAVDKHFVGGKTGTSQTYKHGQALTGTGTTITSFAGFGPIDDPQFVILVKFDRPRSSQWGSDTAAPTFQKIASFLFDYYNIPPDK